MKVLLLLLTMMLDKINKEFIVNSLVVVQLGVVVSIPFHAVARVKKPHHVLWSMLMSCTLRPISYMLVVGTLKLQIYTLNTKD